jgi:23S rRNA pseudouridine2605 synthase
LSFANNACLIAACIGDKTSFMNDKSHKGDRIAKVMARAGLCSRRDAEKWIEAGRVSVNGKAISSPALNVLASDRIIVDGKPMNKEGMKEVRLFRYHKPSGLVTSHKDEKGRATVFDQLPQNLPRLISVGRLDLNTEGLLLLTNDGELSRYLEHPSTGWARRYKVRAYGHIVQERLDALQKGVTIESVKYAGIEAKLKKQQGDNCWIHMTLKEGKNREIRRVLEHLGLKVNRLIRLSYGPFQLGNMKEGSVEEISQKQLKEQLSGFFKK